MDPDPYTPELAVVPFGLHNTGVICHLNALLQALVSCTSFTKAVCRNRKFLSKTNTGRALHDFVACALCLTATKKRTPNFLDPASTRDIESHSARVLAALVRDLRVRRPTVRFGPSQESASEGLVLLLDMLVPPEAEHAHTVARQAAKRAGQPPPPPMEPHPISQLFYHRYEEAVYCSACKRKVGKSTDSGVQFNMFGFDRRPPTTPTQFSEIIRDSVVRLSGYACGRCKKKVEGYRHYLLRMVPEILVVSFNQYQGKQHRYAPATLPFPGLADGSRLVYRQVAQVMHSGTLGGGHYTAYGLRRGGEVHHFNDSGHSPLAAPASTTAYLVFYHFDKLERGACKKVTPDL